MLRFQVRGDQAGGSAGGGEGGGGNDPPDAPGGRRGAEYDMHLPPSGPRAPLHGGAPGACYYIFQFYIQSMFSVQVSLN